MRIVMWHICIRLGPIEHFRDNQQKPTKNPEKFYENQDKISYKSID